MATCDSVMIVDSQISHNHEYREEVCVLRGRRRP